MNKISYISIFLVMFLTLIGCDTHETDFALKEKCAAYIKESKKRAYDAWSPIYFENHLGTHYSKVKNTCISITTATWVNDPSSNGHKYYDELSGHYISPDSKYTHHKEDGTVSYIDYTSFENDLNFIK